MKTRTVVIAASAAFAVAGAAFWWWAGGSARRSDAIFEKLASPGGSHDARSLEQDLTGLYREDPSQAESDWNSHPDYRGPIAAAASTVPGCRPLVERAFQELGPAQRFYITLCLSTGGNPTFRNGAWTGTDSLRVPDDWRAWFEARLDADTAMHVLILTGEALRGAGWKADSKAFLAKSSDATRPITQRGALLAIMASEPGGARSIMDAAENGSIDDEALALVIESGMLRQETDFRAWVERVIAGGSHPVAAGGAFVSLVGEFPDLQERLFETARTAPQGKRLPFMMSLLKSTAWPAVYKAWWIGAWETDAVRNAGARSAIAASGLGTLAAWASREESPQLKLAIQTIYDNLRKQ